MDQCTMPVMAVEFPKSVRIKNKCLGLMYCLLSLAALIVVVADVVHERLYLQIYNPSGRVFFWVDPSTWNSLSDAQIEEVNQQYGNLPVCEVPQRFEYCDAPGCSDFIWRDFICQDLCSETNTGDCAEKTERWFKEDSGIFIPTYFNDTILTDPGGARTVQTMQRILKGPEELVLSFDHEYAVASGGGQNIARGDNKDEEGDLLTVLVDNEKDDSGNFINNEVQRWEPGDTVNIPLRLILELGGVSLDAVKEDYGENYLEGSEYPAGVLARLAGVEIDVELNYANRQLSRTSDWYGPVCYIRINSAVAWTSKPMLDLLDASGSQRLRYYQGVRIKFRSGGVWGVLSFGQILGALTSCLVFMGAAKKLTLVFATSCLGALSRIYKRAIQQEVSVEADACGLAARLTASASGFMELKDSKDGVSRKRLEKRFDRIFQDEEALNTREIKRFSNYVYDRMTQRGETSISIQEYARSCAVGEIISVKSLIEIFDADRKKSFLEQVFVDDSLRAIMKSDKTLRAQKTLRGQDGEPGKRKSTEKQQHEQTALESVDIEALPGKSLDTTTPSKPLVGDGNFTTASLPQSHLETKADDPLAGMDTKDLTSSKLAQEELAEEDGVDEEDLLEIIQGTEMALKEQLKRLEKDHGNLRATVQSQTSQIEELGHSIDSMQSWVQEQKMAPSIEKMQGEKVDHYSMLVRGQKIDPPIETVQVLQQRLEEHERKLKSLNDLHGQTQPVQESGKLQNCMSMLDSLKEAQSNCTLDIDRLTRESRQLQSEMEKISRRGNVGNSGGMVVEETTRRVIRGTPEQSNLSNDVSRTYSPQGIPQGASDKRKERPCGIPAAWDLCGDRPLETHEVVNNQKDRVNAEEVKINGHVVSRT
eukprot:gnl/MRDRNA2_/MRDRNA2_125499_c0_seq1.p1 gnl/MRDRNA2_/MRDRNA2_125499_c0~~gnl/MRDRNA2_/MRDRNA2_125499_c0_seq1.p1  ORF type:complete len:876 (+),score=178.17 gnl/MRDRNA2_/MRDRNA2_125499_c0_seq1:115-2742(+)